MLARLASRLTVKRSFANADEIESRIVDPVYEFLFLRFYAQFRGKGVFFRRFDLSCSIDVISIVQMPCWMNHVAFWLHDHQSLVAGIMALIGAGATVWIISRQIIEQKKADQAILERRQRMRKAGLPIDLSEINKYAEACITTMLSTLARWKEFEEWNKKGDFEFAPDLVEFPFQAMKNLQGAIEYADIQDAEAISSVIEFGQIQRARFESTCDQFHEDSRDENLVFTHLEMYARVREALELHAHNGRIYDYARRITENVSDFPAVPYLSQFIRGRFSYSNYRDELTEYLKSRWGNHWGKQVLERRQK